MKTRDSAVKKTEGMMELELISKESQHQSAPLGINNEVEKHVH